MPDAATHILIQILINQYLLIRRILPYTLFGAVAPDLLKGLTRWLPPEERWLFYPTHSPIFMLVFFYTISMLFHHKERLTLITGCLIGMVIHLLLDLFQINLGGGYYMPFFPLSFQTVTFDFYKPEASIYWLPLIIFVTIMAVVTRKMLRGKVKSFQK